VRIKGKDEQADEKGDAVDDKQRNNRIGVNGNGFLRDMIGDVPDDGEENRNEKKLHFQTPVERGASEVQRAAVRVSPSDGGERRFSYAAYRLKMSDTFVPPKPNALLRAKEIRASRA
jgi:hypothetical protein